MQQNIYLEKLDSYYNTANHQVDYYLNSYNGPLHLNELLNKNISIEIGDFVCLNCGLPKEPFQMGMCKSCYFTSPKAGKWIFNPELSTAQEGEEDRDLAFEKKYQLQPHIVYLSYTDKVKVGVTRKEGQFTRWVNQGAIYATVIAECNDRYSAGIIESQAKQFISDKTNTSKMIVTTSLNKNEVQQEFKESLNRLLSNDIRDLKESVDEVYSLLYPISQDFNKELKYKIVKENLINSQKVVGLKGNLIIFAGGSYINLRNHLGKSIVIYVDLE